MREPLSPELALVDPDLAARARAALPLPSPPRRTVTPTPSVEEAPVEVATAPAVAESARPYPVWARVTAALWLLLIGILIGGAAIPHAQDSPRVLPAGEDTSTICEPPATPPTTPGTGNPITPGP